MSQLSKYQRGNVVYRHATEDDNKDLKKLLSDNDMESWIRLSFEREPSFFKGQNLMGESYAVIVHKADSPTSIIGMYACEFLPVHINGKKEIIGYLAGLRVAKAYRNKIRYIKGGYDSIPKLIPNKATLPSWFTSIAIDNDAARNLLEAGLKNLPCYTPIQQMTTLAISTQQAKKTGGLQKLDKQDIPALVSFYNQHVSGYQFSPVLTEQWLLNLNTEKGLSLDDFYLLKENEKIIACLALWDQRAYKQTGVKSYRFPLNKLRRLINFFAKLTRRLPLPKEGEKLDLIYLSFLAMDNNYQNRSISIIQDALCKAKEKGAKGITLGLSDANPILAMIKSTFYTHNYQTCIETVSWSDKNNSEMMQLKNPQVQPEIALL